MSDTKTVVRSEVGAVSAEYAALVAGIAAAGVIVSAALRWVVQHQDLVLIFMARVADLIRRLLELLR